MKIKKDIKDLVKEKYGQIADNSNKANCCCGCAPTTEDVSTYTVFSDEYTKLEGYVPDADLNLGCGLPTEVAGIKLGDTVLDLGSGAGNDCFVARAIVGDAGRVIGVDFTPSMVAKADVNMQKLGYKNVEFLLGDIDNLPLQENRVDVVISNCVLNLVPDKAAAFSEMYRVIKPGGHFCVSDIVLKGELPDAFREDAVMWAGCVSGAEQKEDYLEGIRKAGFSNVEVKKEKQVTLPDELLVKYLDESQLKAYRESGTGVFSITVTGYK